MRRAVPKGISQSGEARAQRQPAHSGMRDNGLVGSGAALEGHVVEVVEETSSRKSDVGEHAGPELTARRPDQPTVIQFCPLPIRLFQAPVRWRVEEFVFIPVAAFSRRTADLGVGVFPEEPAAPKWLLEDVALICDAG